LQRHSDTLGQFGWEPSGSMNLADKRKSKGSIGEHTYVALETIVAPDEDFKLVSRIDSIGGATRRLDRLRSGRLLDEQQT
jgi:hypothetical protein